MPIIAISRGTFSGGEEVARAVADRLGCSCVSREVILDAAWGHGIPMGEMIAAMDKRPPLWRRFAGERNAHLILMRSALCEHALR
ncbi:MAG: cytidylate kinase family protein, partial [Candidatus Methylomirabilota bacterium]